MGGGHEDDTTDSVAVAGSGSSGDGNNGRSSGESPGRRRRTVIGGLAGAVVVVAALVAIAVSQLSGDDADEAAADAGTPSATTEPPETTTSASTTTSAPEPALQPVDGIRGTFRMNLPETWRHVALDGDATGVGAELFPESADQAGFADNIAGVIAATGARLLAADGEIPDHGAPLPAFVSIQSQPSSMDLAAALTAFKEAYAQVGAEGLTEGRLTGAAGEIAWVANTNTGASFERVDYIAVHGSQVWKLTYLTFHELQFERELADEIAVSFAPT